MKPFSADGRAKKKNRTTAQRRNDKAKHDGRARHNGPARHDAKAHHNGRANKEDAARKSLAASYDQFKEFEGRRYTGMKIGRSHKWYYDQGEWKETKVTPDKWQIAYAVTKRRAGKAPEGSGVPVGTEYHWYILAHQNVKKLNANDYSTSLSGVKFKVAHKRADTEKWSASQRAQRRRMIKFLQEMIEELEEQEAGEQKPARRTAEPKAAKAKAAKTASAQPERADEQPTRRRAKASPRRRQRKAVAA